MPVFEEEEDLDDDAAEETFSDDAGDDAFDDVPETHLSDEDYEQFVAEELDVEGRPRGDPPVVPALVLLTVLVLAVLLLVFT